MPFFLFSLVRIDGRRRAVMTFGFAAAAAGCSHGQAQETAGRLHRLASAIKVETFLLARASITEGRRVGFSSYWLQRRLPIRSLHTFSFVFVCCQGAKGGWPRITTGRFS